jgi:hypothetical protein
MPRRLGAQDRSYQQNHRRRQARAASVRFDPLDIQRSLARDRRAVSCVVPDQVRHIQFRENDAGVFFGRESRLADARLHHHRALERDEVETLRIIGFPALGGNRGR